MKDAQQWKAEAKKQRETAARDRLATAITVDTAEATAEDLIRNHAGDARAFPSFVDRGIALAASRAAVDQLRPHVLRDAFDSTVPLNDRRREAVSLSRTTAQESGPAFEAAL